MPVAFLIMEFTQPAPAMPSPGNSIRIVTARGLDDEEKVIFSQKHAIHLRQAFTNTHNKGTPLEDMMKDVPAMLTTLENMGYHVTASTSNSLFKMRDMPEPVIRDCYLWTLRKAEAPQEPIA
ncbi:unnamed protein product [Allacma fusca]|uniref:Uncharacterized protein n=1 Tax=Allacma fusca TaxID=39272 RepID=A0A8J2LSR4_9HEXA|nr:unnamed protein product [Allacma fusca]